VIVAANTASAARKAPLVVIAVIWFVFEVRQGLQRRSEAVVADRGSRMVLRVTPIAGVLLAVCRRAVPAADFGGAGAAWAGLVVFAAGVALRLWSFRTLGRYFTFTVQTSRDQPVVAVGPYRAIRHPGYAGILLALVGVGLLIGNWLSLLALVAGAAIGLVYRIGVEERVLLADLGDRYRDDADGRKRLVAFVW